MFDVFGKDCPPERTPAMNVHRYQRVVATAEEIAAFVAKKGYEPVVYRVQCSNCGARLWGSGLGIGAHDRSRKCREFDPSAPATAPAVSAKRSELVAAVKAHAAANYANGWDVIVECYDDAEIAKVIGRARTLKGAIAKFASVVDVVSDRRAAAEAEIAAAVGTEPVDHYVADSRSYDGMFDCACGREFLTAKAADLHVAAEMEKRGTYDRFAPGHHPDGSYVSLRHTHDGEFLYATRTWEGRVGSGHIEDAFTPRGEYLGMVEHYTPGWRGVNLESANFCDHDPAKVDESGVCWNSLCLRRECVPF
jgi:hypothetical protein